MITIFALGFPEVSWYYSHTVTVKFESTGTVAHFGNSLMLVPVTFNIWVKNKRQNSMYRYIHGSEKTTSEVKLFFLHG